MQAEDATRNLINSCILSDWTKWPTITATTTIMHKESMSLSRLPRNPRSIDRLIPGVTVVTPWERGLGGPQARSQPILELSMRSLLKRVDISFYSNSYDMETMMIVRKRSSWASKDNFFLNKSLTRVLNQVIRENMTSWLVSNIFCNSEFSNLMDFSWIFNERAARRSRSTSRFGCLVSSRLVCLFVTVSPPSWTTQEQLQSGITMASVNRIDSNFFLWLRVCLLYVDDNIPRAPRARGYVHVPFYEGTCQNWLSATGETLEIYLGET